MKAKLVFEDSTIVGTARQWAESNGTGELLLRCPAGTEMPAPLSSLKLEIDGEAVGEFVVRAAYDRSLGWMGDRDFAVTLLREG